MLNPSRVERISPSAEVVCLMWKLPVGRVVGGFLISDMAMLID